jgi:hypothetical protein
MEVAVPWLDAKALQTDPEGLAFLRSVLMTSVRKGPRAACEVSGESTPERVAPRAAATDNTERLSEAYPPARVEPMRCRHGESSGHEAEQNARRGI